MIRSIMMAGMLVLTPIYALANSFYLDVLVGQTEQETDIDNEGSFKSDDLSLGLQVGYQFLPFLALEGGYTDHGEASKRAGLGRANMETTVANLGLKFILPIGDVARLYARAGVGWWEYSQSYQGALIDIHDDDEGSDFYIGLGAHFNVNDFVYLGVEVNQMKMDLNLRDSTAADVDVENTLTHAAFKIGFYF